MEKTQVFQSSRYEQTPERDYILTGNFIKYALIVPD